MNKLYLLLAAVTISFGSAFAGYKLNNSDQLYVEQLIAPDLYSSKYDRVNHIYPVSAEMSEREIFSRTVSKDEYIDWLEVTLQAVMIQEQINGVERSNKKLSEFIDSMRDVMLTSAFTPQMTDEQFTSAKNQMLTQYFDGTTLAAEISSRQGGL